ncbi:hypothetical protein P43SY_004064 [Pythium insidiosum]|uniref:PX domain-containing protein n=1 Tax=Pythium insidiosum TaxID=114742 RepID=A0AAD5LED3_PYTIN|nr:hypothetical protein P43SY_004064 [Pythium insidiosum]
MYATAAQDAARGERYEAIEREIKRLKAARLPLDFSERVRRATRHCSGDILGSAFPPPRELYMLDAAGTLPSPAVRLDGFVLSTESLGIVVADILSAHAALEKRQREKLPLPVRRLHLADTALSDAGLQPVQRLKGVVMVDISRCSALTDASATLLRRHFSGSLQELHISECRHISSDVLCQLWRDCVRLHTLVARGCPGVTDSVLQCISTTKRLSPDVCLRVLDTSNCKHVTSSGLTHIATSAQRELRLTSLRVRDCLGVDNMGFFGFEASHSVGSLTTLDLSGLKIDETGLSWIVKGCHQLEHLVLARCKALNDFALSLLSPLIPLKLKSLSIKECPLISDRGINDLFAVAERNRDSGINNGLEADDYPGQFKSIATMRHFAFSDTFVAIMVDAAHCMIDAKRNPMDELYRRAKLPREKEVFQQVKDKWEANTIVQQRAVRKLRREVDQIWSATSEVIENHHAVRRKLYGVTENVYISHCEFEERKERNASLNNELTDLQERISTCKDMLRAAIASRRMLDGEEIFSVRCIMLNDTESTSSRAPDSAPKSNKQKFLEELESWHHPFGLACEPDAVTHPGKVYTIRRSYAEFKKLHAAMTPLMGSSGGLPKLPAQSLFAFFAGETQALLEKRRVTLDRLLKVIEAHSVASDSTAFLEFVANTEHYEQFHDAPASPPASHTQQLSYTFENRGMVAPVSSLDSDLASRRRNSQVVAPQSLTPNRERKARRNTIECPTENCVEFARYTML